MLQVHNACVELNQRLQPYREKLGPDATLAALAGAAWGDRISLSATGEFSFLFLVSLTKADQLERQQAIMQHLLSAMCGGLMQREEGGTVKERSATFSTTILKVRNLSSSPALLESS
jgi:hypothetical protein